MKELETLLFANEAFYRAFADRDLDALEGMWSVTAPVVCIHPGWPPLHGREQVMESWTAILTGPNPPLIEEYGATAHLVGNMGLVTCYEKIHEDWLVATNLFVREGNGWALCHHQSGPAAGPPEEDEIDPPKPLN